MVCVEFLQMYGHVRPQVCPCFAHTVPSVDKTFRVAERTLLSASIQVQEGWRGWVFLSMQGMLEKRRKKGHRTSSEMIEHFLSEFTGYLSGIHWIPWQRQMSHPYSTVPTKQCHLQGGNTHSRSWEFTKASKKRQVGVEENEENQELEEVYLSIYYQVSILPFQNILKIIFSKQFFNAKVVIYSQEVTKKCSGLSCASFAQTLHHDSEDVDGELCIMVEQDQDQEITRSLCRKCWGGHCCLVLHCRGKSSGSPGQICRQLSATTDYCHQAEKVPLSSLPPEFVLKAQNSVKHAFWSER